MKNLSLGEIEMFPNGIINLWLSSLLFSIAM